MYKRSFSSHFEFAVTVAADDEAFILRLSNPVGISDADRAMAAITMLVLPSALFNSEQIGIEVLPDIGAHHLPATLVRKPMAWSGIVCSPFDLWRNILPPRYEGDKSIRPLECSFFEHLCREAFEEVRTLSQDHSSLIASASR